MIDCIAQVQFIAVKPQSPNKIIKVRIAKPELDPESQYGDHRCLVEIEGIQTSSFVYGLDSLQALALAMALVKSKLTDMERMGWTLTYDGKETSQVTGTNSLIDSYFLR